MVEEGFFSQVFKVTALIPYGRVTSYGAIAKFLASPGSARMVGWALNNCDKQNVPAHRVVNRMGLLTGKHHFQGTNLMQQLLESEGVKVVENKVMDFERLFWDPTKEL